MAVPLMPKEDVAAMYARVSEATPDVSVIKRRFPSCPYGDDPRQAVDIYLPNEGTGPFPVVFFLHGGGWMSGSRSDAQMAAFIWAVRRGYAFVSIGYRLSPKVTYPENLFDVRRALRWCAENAETYMLDKTRCALTGASAGGHLALMAAFTQGIPAFDDAPEHETCKILAVVDQFAPTDFLKKHTQFDESGFPRADDPEDDSPDMIDVMLGTRLADAPGLERFVSPIFSVHKDVPPTFIMHGLHDPSVPYQQSVTLYEKINELAGEKRAELWLSDEFLHADPGYAGEEGQERIFGFLDRYLKA